jgi:hypothetical protein
MSSDRPFDRISSCCSQLHSCILLRTVVLSYPGFSERLALCITREYPTFTRLWSAYAACATDKQRECLVQDLAVNTPAAVAAAPSARVTRVGPALSKALYQSIWLEQSESTQTATVPGAADEEQQD